ncbi:hypothetical protein DAI22_03g153700 [Oryza sativa Japonica Group]|nr:hypothetical protein DAI22_03g153700 [Oryza sativa Japonica Group]
MAATPPPTPLLPLAVHSSDSSAASSSTGETNLAPPPPPPPPPHRWRRLGEDAVAVAAGTSPLALPPPNSVTPSPRSGDDLPERPYPPRRASPRQIKFFSSLQCRSSLRPPLSLHARMSTSF